MISRPDEKYLKATPKSSNFTFLIPVISDVKELEASDYKPIVLQSFKKYDPVKGLKKLLKYFSSINEGKDISNNFRTYTIPEKLLLEQYAIGARFLLTTNMATIEEVFPDTIPVENFESEEEAEYINSRIAPALQIIQFIIRSIQAQEVADFNNVDKEDAYIYKIDEESVVGEYCITKTNYDVFGQNVLVCEFMKLPSIDSLPESVLGKELDNGDKTCE